MPKLYTRKTDKQSWTLEQLNAALAEIRSGRPVRAVGREFNIPESTLRDKLKLTIVAVPKLGRRTVFTAEEENELAEHIKKLSNMFFGITPTQLRELVFSYAERNNIIHNFNRQSRTAGKDWLRLFLRRNDGISIRKPEGTSINRIQAFNKEEVSRYFANLDVVLQKHNFGPSRIFNVDETGISTVQKPAKILSPKGQKQVGYAISWERGKNVTIVCAFSASGTYVPPMFIFPRQRHSPQLEKGGPLGATYTCSKNGWINGDLFFEWLKHFQNHVKSSKEDSVLLLLDNHVSHTSLDIYQYCRENGIVMVSIPPHTSHRLQPLDLTFYGPLKNAYNRECDSYLRANAHKKITHYELVELFNRAYMKTATLEKAEAGFRTAGIFPFQPDKFDSRDFAPAQHFMPVEYTEQETGQTENLPAAPSNNAQENVSCISLSKEPPPSSKEPQPCSSKEPQPCSSKKQKHDSIPQLQNSSCSKRILQDPVVIPFSSIAPVPRPNTNTAKPNNKRKHSEILTSTPIKLVLEENVLKKVAAAEKKVAAAEKKEAVAKKKVTASEKKGKTNQ